MDSAIRKERGGVCVGGGGMGRHACWHVSLQSPLVSLPSRRPTPPRWRLTGACQEPEHGRTDRRATQYKAALAVCRHSTAHEDDAAAGLIPTWRCAISIMTSNRHRNRDFLSKDVIVIDRSRLWRNRNNTINNIELWKYRTSKKYKLKKHKIEIIQ